VATPYVTPAMITNAPTGISWSIIPFPKATSSQQFAEQTNICWRATQIVDGFVNQVFRSTIDNEQYSGPGTYRINVEQSTGNVRWILTRYPVTDILAIQVSSNAVFPRQWTQVTSGYWDIENPLLGVYGSYVAAGSGGGGGQSILLAPGFAGWWLGRGGYRFACSYLNGWPHAGLMTSVTAGATTLVVDDVTGMAGASVFIYDGAFTETVQVVSVTANANVTLPNSGGTVPAGPGTLTLASPVLFNHEGDTPATVTVSAIPTDVLWATVLAATTQALDSGITSVTIQNLPGSQTVGGHGIDSLTRQYEDLLRPYKRVI
jgi:hypothetical protein